MITFPDTHVVPLNADEMAQIDDGTRQLGADARELFNDPGVQMSALRTITAAWPELSDLAGRLDALLDRPPHLAVLRNVPLASPNTFFVALTRSLGTLAEPYRTSWSRTISYIRPQTDRSVAGSGALNQYLHTDGTHWPRPNDLTCLLCVSPDQNAGGRSRLLPVDRLRAELDRREPSLLQVLTEQAVPWALDHDLGGGIAWAPVFSDSDIRWLKHTIDQAAAGERVPPAVGEALRRLETFLEECLGVVEIALEAGDLLLVNNRRCMHARTPIPDIAGSKRFVCRIKVNR